MRLNAWDRPADPALPDRPAPEPAPHRTAPEPGHRRIPARIRHGHLAIAGRELSTPLVLTIGFDILLLASVGLLAPSVRFAQWPMSTALPAEPLKITAFTLIGLLALLSVGFYRRGLRAGFNEVLLRIIGALGLSGIGLGFTNRGRSRRGSVRHRTDAA